MQQSATIRRIEKIIKQLNSDEYEAALPAIDTLIGMRDDEAKVVGHHLKGIALMGMENFVGATQEFSTSIGIAEAKNLILTAPEKISEIFVFRGICYLKENDLRNAISDFTKGISLAPQQTFGYSRRGAALRQLGNLTHALSDIDQALQLDPSDAANYRERGRLKMPRL
jgi:Flp pilus assembly protein TadD